MGAVELLKQAYYIDVRIDNKLEQMEALNALATKATTTFGNEPVSGTRDVHKREETICKIVDLQNEINADIDSLVDLKRELRKTIESIPNVDYRTVLELRYLNFRKWEEIAVTMGYRLRNVHYIHDKAIEYLDGEKK
jgi:DNA-directed RNA polymerase specialized sigma subunit